MSSFGGTNSHSRSTDSLLSYNSKSNTSVYSYATQSETSSIIQNGYNVKEGNFVKSSPWLKKPVWAACDESIPSSSKKSALDRHLSLVDLISIGVAATVGSGIFVLSGLIAHDYAGPASFISWGIAGVCVCASGLCYAELSGNFFVSGSTYAYAYMSMGELPAVIAGACLTLEYVFAASAVARSWGDKMVEFLKMSYYASEGVNAIDDSSQYGASVLLHILDPGYGINPMAFLVSTCSVLLLLIGVKESKNVTNVMTTFKIGIVLFMCIGAFFLMEKENLQPLIPAKFGLAGIFRGSTSSFFGYIGFDEICCMTGEAKNPSTNMPRAVLGTIGIVTLLYMLAAITLTGMLPYEDISVTSGFPDGFRTRGLKWASDISAVGELVALPIVVLVTIMAQPRLQFAMASDGLLPSIFTEIDNDGNLWYGTIFSGILMVVIATCVPFYSLNDLLSAGVLVAFTLTDMSVILLRQTSPSHHPSLLEKLLAWFNFLSFALGIFLRHFLKSLLGQMISFVLLLSLLSLTSSIARKCPMLDTSTYGSGTFRTPFLPYLPLFAIFSNWYLIAQLEVWGLFLLGGYIGIAVLFYFAYGFKHSVGNRHGWDATPENDPINRFQKPMQTMISLPRVISKA